jgi:hypothetical protein
VTAQAIALDILIVVALANILVMAPNCALDVGSVFVLAIAYPLTLELPLAPWVFLTNQVRLAHSVFLTNQVRLARSVPLTSQFPGDCFRV